MEQEIFWKKSLIFNVIDFLMEEVNSSELSDEKKESLEVAIQCLESSYEIDIDDREHLPKIDLLGHFRAFKVEISEEQLKVAEHHKNLGNAAMKSGQYEEAVTQYTKAIDINPRCAIYYCNRAAGYSRLGNNDACIKDCNQALRIDPTYGKAYGRLGIAYSNLNMWPDAVRSYEQSLRYDPDNIGYQTNLRLARDHLFASMENAAPPQHRPLDISQFINSHEFVTLAREMMVNPDFQNIMSGIMAMSQSGDTNFEALFQAGEDLASNVNGRNPNFVETLRRHFNIYGPLEPAGASGDPLEKSDSDEGPAGRDAQ